MPSVCVSATSDSLVSHCPSPRYLPLLNPGWGVFPRRTGEPQKCPLPAPPSVAQGPVGSPGQLESEFSSHCPLSPHPTPTPRHTPPLSQNGERREKIRLKWLRTPQPCLETHTRRTTPLDAQTSPQPPSRAHQKFGDLRLQPPPSLTSHLAFSLR